jgi:hypothetical protein
MLDGGGHTGQITRRTGFVIICGHEGLRRFHGYDAALNQQPGQQAIAAPGQQVGGNIGFREEGPIHEAIYGLRFTIYDLRMLLES